MARRDALIRLHKSLLGRRSDLRNKLADELSNMRNFRAGDNTGDSADVAFETGSDEMSSQLAAIDGIVILEIADYNMAGSEWTHTFWLNRLKNKSLTLSHKGTINEGTPMRVKAKLTALSQTIHVYPTLAQIARRAVNTYFGPRLFSDRTRKLVG